MYRYLIIFSIFTFLSVILFAQEQKTEEINPELISYYKNLNKEKIYKNYGYIPPSVKPHFQQLKLKQTKNFNPVYDMRDLNWVTPVKDQKGCGSCWNFSTMAAIESNWIMIGLGEFDLSEQNLRTCQMFNREFTCIGGNELIASSYYFSGLGPVSEVDDPYPPNPSPLTTCTENYPIVAYIPEARYLPGNKDVIKQAILDVGGVYSSMHMLDGPDFFDTDSTYYYNQDDDVNHAIVIIGWDDDMNISGKTGAWIIKNSWGTNWGSKGYFYIAYDDTRILSQNATFPTQVDANKYETIYHYDSLGWLSNTGFSEETAYGLVKFTAVGKQKISDIGTYVNSSNTILNIQIYLGKNGSHLYGLAAELNNLTCQFPGHYIFNLDKEINISEGSDFYVKVKYQTPGYNFPIPSEKYMEVDGNVYANPLIENNVCWISSTSDSWLQLGSNIENELSNIDLTIKAYGIADTVLTEDDMSINISPNPSNGFITVDLQNINQVDVTLELSNSRGKLIYKSTFANTQSYFNHQIDINSLTQGFYILRITNGDFIDSRKIILTN